MNLRHIRAKGESAERLGVSDVRAVNIGRRIDEVF